MKTLVLQSLILKKAAFTKTRAAQWAKAHGFRSDPDEKTATFRFRQVEPSKFQRKTFRTVRFNGDISAVFGYRK